MADLRYLLAIYVHAHQTGNSVPPHIEAEARAALATPPAVDGPAVPQEGREPAAVVDQASKEILLNLRLNIDPALAGQLTSLVQDVANAVTPHGGYEPGDGSQDGSQLVDLQWWSPEHGCDSLELTLDAIRARLIAAVTNWYRTTLSASSAPVEGEVGELMHYLEQAAEGAAAMGHELDSWAIARAAALLEQQAAELAVLRAGVQVPVVKRPRGQPGWCDAEGRCWMGVPGGQGFIPSWRFCRPEDAPHMTCSLPHWAIPQPPQGGEVEHG